MAARPSVSECCKLLQIEKDCSDRGAIEKAYKARALACHPDKGGDAESFKRLQDAHRVMLRHAHQTQWATSSSAYGAGLPTEALKIQDVNAFRL
jgi:DnaJ-class molecular chaperone